MPTIAKLALEDGTVFTGRGFGAAGEADGEVVFNTSMTGYQEILTDPSYHGQIVAMTYPLIGNYGVNPEDVESGRPWVRGFVVRELSRVASNFRSRRDRSTPTSPRNGILGIEGIDTRALVRMTRERRRDEGHPLDDRPRRRLARGQGQGVSPGLVGRDLTGEVMPAEAKAWEPGFESPFAEKRRATVGPIGKRPHVVALDFGMKWNIPRHLVETGCRVTVLPGTAPAEAVLEHEPDGIFLSNGPGDPAALGEAVATLATLIRDGRRVARACRSSASAWAISCSARRSGAKTFKLKFGHRGANHPVRDERTGQGRDHHPEPRLRRRPGHAARRRRAHATST